MFRIYHEMRTQLHRGWFLTFTYNDWHLPKGKDGRPSLRFKDIQLVFKRMRKAGHYCKYVCVGEYGPQTLRPHYHLLLWTDMSLTDVEKFWTDRKGRPLGRVHFGTLTMKSAMYAMKYVMQPKVKYEGVEKPRAQFSRGIGLAYLSKAMYNYHTANYEEPITTGLCEGKVMQLPRYYCRKIFTKYQMRLEAHRNRVRIIREKRKAIIAARPAMRSQGFTYFSLKNYDKFIEPIRVEQARRVINKCKVNLTI